MGRVLPVHPFKGRDLDLEHISPCPGMDQLVLIRAVDLLSQRVIVRISNRSCRWRDTSIREPLVIHNRYVLAAMIRMVNQTARFFRACDRLIQCL